MLGKEESYRGQDIGVNLEGLTPLSIVKESEEHDKAQGITVMPVPVLVPNESGGAPVDLSGGLVTPKDVSWFQQLKWCLFKNKLLLARRPIILFLMTFSSVFSVLLSWLAGRDAKGIFPTEHLDQCGVIEDLHYREFEDANPRWSIDNEDRYILSLNESWRSGFPVALLSIGPFLQAVCAFLMVHAEIEKKLVGVIRGLGVRESAFWMSWYLPFVASSMVNSLLGAITAQFIPVHVFQSVYFGGIFASLFFLQLALVPASFFLASLCGSNNRAVIFIIMLMGVAIFVPCLITLNSGWYVDPYSVYSDYDTQGFSGLMWTNRNTTELVQPYLPYSDGYYNDPIDNSTCNLPIMNEEQGTMYKTEEERTQVTPDEFFIGCYFQPGYTSAQFNPAGRVPVPIMYLLPYFHFMAIYSNFLGYTGTPGKEFGPTQAGWSPEDLAIDTLPTPPNEANSYGTSLFPQGSTLQRSYYYDYDAMEEFRCKHGEPSSYYWSGSCVSEESPNVCPSANLTGFDICDTWQDCDYVKNSQPLISSPSVYNLLGYLFSISILYLIVASYWLQVLPAGNGAPRKFYFFLNLRYWIGSNNKVADGDGKDTVSINNVSKSFGACKAVKDLTLELKKGQVTALLGHNGAGKSTLTNILSCEIVPTNGNVSIFGASVSEDPYAIRRLVGICKQDDFLWPNLTAKEHLDIFAGLRGVDPDLHDKTVQKWLNSVDLTIQQDMFSSAFSGGMKRRLSVALSTIGDRPFLIFDEPTTGMDPVNRRFVWQHLDDIKDGRVVLLTTHAMEEADLLADEVAIMKKGEVAALGSPLELKSAHGSALQFSILVEKEHKDTTEEAIRTIFHDNFDYVTVTSGDAGNITVKIDKIQNEEVSLQECVGVRVSSLSEFVGWLESDESNVCEYGFSNSSLEEVFIAITRDDGEQNGIGQGSNGEEETQDSGNEYILEENMEFARNISTFKPRLSVLNQIWALLYHSFQRKWWGRRAIFEYVIYGLFVIGTITAGVLSASDGDIVFMPLLNILPIAGLSLMLISVTLPLYRDKATGLFHLMRTQGLRQSSFIGGTTAFAFLNQLFYGLVLFILFYATPLFRETKLCDRVIYDYYGWTDRTPYYGNDTQNDSIPEDDQFPYYGNDTLNDSIPEDDQFLCYVNDMGPGSIYHAQATVFGIDNGVSLETVRTPGGFLQILVIPFLFALSMPGTVLLTSIIPGNFKFALSIVGFIVTVAFLSPVVYTVFWYYSIADSYYNSYGDYYADDDAMASPLEKCMRLIDPDDLCSGGISADMQPEQALNCIGLGLGNVITLPSLCAPSYASMLPQFATNQLLVTSLFSEIKFWPESMDSFLEIFPEADCSGNTCKFPYAQKVYHEHARYFFLGAILLNLIGFALFIIVWFPPAFIMDCKNSCSNALRSIFCCDKSVKEQENEEVLGEITLEEVTSERNKVVEIVRPFLQPRDISTVEAAEDNDALIIDYEAKSECRDLPPILMHKLRKVYPSSGRTPPKVAVQSLDLHVPKGQVCGLLGKNGSGKTTALKILSNNHEASAGLALVSGYDVNNEKIKACENLGNCPQFDKVWEFLTVREHLEFFARLKGLPNVKEASQAIAKAVGLGAPAVYNRAAKHLSGGMRRRLSIAISFVGAPNVLLLDEPTTGLDPSTRNEIWGLTSAFATEERAIVITTHMMIEADTLCNRIAIIGDGKLRVVATQQHLKDKYGSGYILQLNLIRSTQEHQDRAMAFVRTRLHESAVLDNKQAKTLHIHLPRNINLNKVFTALYSPERSTKGCINQFLLSQSSLEDVFIALG